MNSVNTFDVGCSNSNTSKTMGSCLAVIIRAIETDIIHRAVLTQASAAGAGIVTLIQRFESALNPNTHRLMILLDGVYTADKSGKAKFHRVKAPNQIELQTLLNRYRTHHLSERTNPPKRSLQIGMVFHSTQRSLVNRYQRDIRVECDLGC